MWTVAESSTDKSKKSSYLNSLGHAQEAITGVCYGTYWKPSEELFGVHQTRLEAQRSIVKVFYPEHVGCSVEHVKRLIKEFVSGKSPTLKVVKKS
jgi:hypothetical protein